MVGDSHFLPSFTLLISFSSVNYFPECIIITLRKKKFIVIVILIGIKYKHIYFQDERAAVSDVGQSFISARKASNSARGTVPEASYGMSEYKCSGYIILFLKFQIKEIKVDAVTLLLVAEASNERNIIHCSGGVFFVPEASYDRNNNVAMRIFFFLEASN